MSDMRAEERLSGGERRLTMGSKGWGGQRGKETVKAEAGAVWMQMQKERIALPAELNFHLQKLSSTSQLV